MLYYYSFNDFYNVSYNLHFSILLLLIAIVCIPIKKEIGEIDHKLEVKINCYNLGCILHNFIQSAHLNHLFLIIYTSVLVYLHLFCGNRKWTICLSRYSAFMLKDYNIIHTGYFARPHVDVWNCGLVLSSLHAMLLPWEAVW